MNDQREQLAAAGRIRMPSSPIPVHEEIRDASRDVIEAEQWLHSHGWRDTLTRLASAESGEFLAAYRDFRDRLGVELAAERARGAASDGPRMVYAALGGFIVGALATYAAGAGLLGLG